MIFLKLIFLLGVAIVITPPGHKKAATPLVVARNELGLICTETGRMTAAGHLTVPVLHLTVSLIFHV
jgi:hypothetical protein